MASKSLAEYFGDVFLNQSRFDAAHLFEIWQQLANRRDELFVDNCSDPSQRVIISRVAQMDTEVALKFVGKKMARPPPILDSGLFGQDLHDINMLIPTMHNLFYCQRTGLNLFLQHIVPPEAPQRNKFLHYLKNMVLLQEKGEINSSASSYRRYVGEVVPLFKKSCEKLPPRQRLFSTIPLLLNWLSFLYYFTDLPYTLYLPQLWVISLLLFLLLGDASLEFHGSNAMSCLYGVDLGHAVNFFRKFRLALGDLNEEPFEGEFIRHKEHSVAVRSRTDLRQEVLLSFRARIRNVLVPRKNSSSMLKNFIRTSAFRDIIIHPCLFFKSGRWKFNCLASLREMAQERDVLEIAFFTKHQGWYFKIGDAADS